MGLLVLLMVGFCLVLLAFVGGANGMVVPIPHEYGRVIIRNFSEQAGLGAARFDHWLHRAFYTCRLCHVDIGFAMEANATKIKADTNMRGFHCGSCHNGTRVYGSKMIFAACSLTAAPGEDTRCSRCHSVGKKIRKEYDYALFTEKLPRKGVRRLIDWEDAEARGLIQPDGLSSRRIRQTSAIDRAKGLFHCIKELDVRHYFLSSEACPGEWLRGLSSRHLPERQERHAEILNVPDMRWTVLRCLPRSCCLSSEGLSEVSCQPSASIENLSATILTCSQVVISNYSEMVISGD